MSSAKVILSEFDAAEYLDTEEAIAEYLRLSLDEDGAEELADSWADAARAYEMHGLGRKSGLSWEEFRRGFLAANRPRLGVPLGARAFPPPAVAIA